MFSGRFDHAIDDKGRVSIPARFREELERQARDNVTVVATGHTAPLLLAELHSVDHYDQHLTLHGLRLVFERNRDSQRGRLKTAR